MARLPTASNLVAQIDQRVQKVARLIKLVLATVTGYTGGTGIQLKFAEDQAAASTNYLVVGSYAAQKPVVGDTVVVAQIAQDDGSVSCAVFGPLIPPPATSGQARPTGEVTMFAGSSAPTGWLICDGSQVSRTTYADLFAVISTTYGVGDGSTTFNLPNAAGKVPVGVGDAGGTFRGHTNHTLGQTGGEETHQLSTSELPSLAHTHTQGAHTHNYQQETAGGTGGTAGSTRGSTTSSTDSGTGGTTASANPSTGPGDHNNMQPYLVLNLIIKT